MTLTAITKGTSDRDRYIRAVVVAGLLAFLAFVMMQTSLLDQRVQGNFYDIQMRALFDGNLEIPTGSIGPEAFDIDGKHYLYNTPGPSLLRAPVMAVTDRFDGRLTVLSMTGAWLTMTVMLALFMWRVRAMLRKDAPLGNLEAAGYGLLLFTGTAGSVFLFLASIPWVFHEAILWSIPLGLGAVHSLFGFVERPSTRRAVITGLFVLGAILSRVPVGWEAAVAVGALAVWFGLGRATPEHRRLSWQLGLAAALPVAAGVVINYVKFRHLYALPFDQQIATQLLPSRSTSIEANGTDLWNPELVRSTVPAYFDPRGIRFSSLFPWISLPAEPPTEVGTNVLDDAYRTGSVFAFMPLLAPLALWGAWVTLRPSGPKRMVPLRAAVVGFAVFPASILGGAYITHRYTADFLPLLLIGATAGFVELARRAELWSVDLRRGTGAAIGALFLFGAWANTAVAMTAHAQANPGSVLTDHVERQLRMGDLAGDSADKWIQASTDLPLDAPADEIRVVGDCKAVFVSTGESRTPWVEVGQRPVRLDLRQAVDRPAPTASGLPIVTLVGHRRSTVELRPTGGRFEIAVTGGGRTAVSDPFEVPDDEAVALEISSDTPEEFRFRVDGDEVLRVLKATRDTDFILLPEVLTPLSVDSGAAASVGLDVATAEQPSPPLCEELLERRRAVVADGS